MEAKICDKCGRIMPGGFGIENAIFPFLLKSISIKTTLLTPLRSIDLCKDCVKDFLVWVDGKESVGDDHDKET